MAAAIHRNSSPAAASVSTNGAPEPRPTAARNSVRPNVRSVRFAGSGMCHASGPVRPSLPSISATRSGPPARPSVKLPEAGDRNRHEPQQHAERHAEADRHVRHLGRRLDGIAEMLAQRSAGPDASAITATRSPYSSTRSGSASSTASPRRTSTILASMPSGNVILPIGTPVSAARDTKNLAMSSALRSLARRPDSTRPSCRRAWSSAPGSPNSSRPSPASSRICGSGSLFVRPCRTATMCTPGGRPAVTSATVVPGRSSASTTSTVAGGAGAGASRASHEAREDEDAEDGPDDANRIGDGVPHRGRAIAGGVDGGLQRRRAGQRAGEHAQRVRGRDAERRPSDQGHAERAQHARGARARSTSVRIHAGPRRTAGRTGCRCRRGTSRGRSNSRAPAAPPWARSPRAPGPQTARRRCRARSPRSRSGRWRSRCRWPQTAPASATARGARADPALPPSNVAASCG